MTDWAKIVRGISPGAAEHIVAMIADHADEVFPRYGITTIRRQACVLAHMSVETQGFTKLEENLKYSAERLLEVFPTHFNREQAEACALVPQLIADRAYDGRMGNRPGSDDGWLFRGKGLWECTGRSNGELIARKLGITPDQAAVWLIHPDHALECVGALFQILKVAPSADSGNVTEQTKHINGGLNGLYERESAYTKALRLLNLEGANKRVALTEQDTPELQSSVNDLREDGSRTIKGADQSQRGLIGALGSVGGATAALSQVQDTANQVQSAVQTVQSGGALVPWAQTHWPLILAGVATGLAIFFAYRAWQGANAVKLARVDDANTGLNPTRI